jgi:8-oxo-dGTP pyrophosphatase MutT (NUDIX family)
MGGGLRSPEGRHGRRPLMPDFVIPFDRLPEGFAESIEEPPPMPATPRPAATIVLLRDSSNGLEVLLMRRNRSAGFVPGAYVFPGGRVDTSDSGPDVLQHVDDLTDASAAARLDHHGDPPALAFYLAALREAFEETGILVGIRHDGSAPGTAADSPEVDAVRESLMQDRITFADALASLRCRIPGHAVEYIAHWITPEPEPRRYDTRFFAAKVSESARPIVDPREMTDAVWLAPREALTRCEQGDLPMVFPTIRTIEELADYRSADDALRGFGSSPVRTIMPTLVLTPTGVGLRVDD